MRAYHLAAFLALGFWQVAPAPVVPPRAGLFRLGLAYATGEWEDASFDCDGNWTGSTAVPTRSAGATFEYLGSEGELRLTAVGGRWSIDNPSSYYGGYSRTFAGFQVAVEGSKFGLGFGMVSHPPMDESRSTMGSFYARIGDIDDGHFRVEVNPPSETPGMMGVVRVGIGFGKGLERRPNGFLGAAWGPYTDRLGQGVLLADIGIPLFRSLDVLVRGSAGPGEGKLQWAAGGGLRAVW